MDPTELGPTNRPKRPYNKRAPVRPDPVRAAEVRDEPVRTTKVRVRKNTGTNPMDLPKDIMDMLKSEGIDLMWGPNLVLGQPDPARHQQYEINAWEAVTGDMFGGILDGMFMPKGHPGEIVFGSSVLMWRPLELSQESRAEETHAANSARHANEQAIKHATVPGVTMETQTPMARGQTFVKRQVVPGMAIPK